MEYEKRIKELLDAVSTPVYVLEWKYLVAMLSCPVVKSLRTPLLEKPEDVE